MYAEAPERGFMPSGGRYVWAVCLVGQRSWVLALKPSLPSAVDTRRVLRWQVPDSAVFFENGPLRVDSGVEQGDLVGWALLPHRPGLLVHRAPAIEQLVPGSDRRWACTTTR